MGRIDAKLGGVTALRDASASPTSRQQDAFGGGGPNSGLRCATSRRYSQRRPRAAGGRRFATRGIVARRRPSPIAVRRPEPPLIGGIGTGAEPCHEGIPTIYASKTRGDDILPS